jgi:Tetracyclin repressor-like, C-terminal domain
VLPQKAPVGRPRDPSVDVAILAAAESQLRERGPAILENFQRNLSRPHSMALLGSLLAEEGRHPELIGRFRDRLVKPRRTMLAEALASGIQAGRASGTDRCGRLGEPPDWVVLRHPRQPRWCPEGLVTAHPLPTLAVAMTRRRWVGRPRRC